MTDMDDTSHPTAAAWREVAYLRHLAADKLKLALSCLLGGGSKEAARAALRDAQALQDEAEAYIKAHRYGEAQHLKAAYRYHWQRAYDFAEMMYAPKRED